MQLNILPCYILDPKNIYFKRDQAIEYEICELCCDEYYYYLEQIPIKFIISRLSRLLIRSASNGSKICFEFLIKFINDIPPKKEILALEILESATASLKNQINFILWYIKTDLFQQYLNNIMNNIDTFKNCVNSTIQRNNFEIFKELKKIIKFDSFIDIILLKILTFNRIIFFHYVAKKYDLVNKKHLSKQL